MQNFKDGSSKQSSENYGFFSPKTSSPISSLFAPQLELSGTMEKSPENSLLRATAEKNDTIPFPKVEKNGVALYSNCPDNFSNDNTKKPQTEKPHGVLHLDKEVPFIALGNRMCANDKYLVCECPRPLRPNITKELLFI
jgi:hypothetical protein